MWGFFMKEKIERFLWLFETFLEAMDNVQSKTVMTDQAFSMANAIEEVFPLAKYRLCTWHILENSKKNIGYLMVLGGFVDKFVYVLMRCDTEESLIFVDRGEPSLCFVFINVVTKLLLSTH